MPPDTPSDSAQLSQRLLRQIGEEIDRAVAVPETLPDRLARLLRELEAQRRKSED